MIAIARFLQTVKLGIICKLGLVTIHARLPFEKIKEHKIPCQSKCQWKVSKGRKKRKQDL